MASPKKKLTRQDLERLIAVAKLGGHLKGLKAVAADEAAVNMITQLINDIRATGEGEVTTPDEIRTILRGE